MDLLGPGAIWVLTRLTLLLDLLLFPLYAQLMQILYSSLKRPIRASEGIFHFGSGLLGLFAFPL